MTTGVAARTRGLTPTVAAVAGTVGWLAFGFAGVLPLAAAAPALVAAARHDAAFHRVPNRLVARAGLWFAAVATAVAVLVDIPGDLVGSVATGVGTLSLITLPLALTGGLGMGDVKLSAVLGAAAGWATACRGLPVAVAGAASLVILLVACLMTLRRARRAPGAVPFGPPLTIATAVVLLAVGVA